MHTFVSRFSCVPIYLRRQRVGERRGDSRRAHRVGVAQFSRCSHTPACQASAKPKPLALPSFGVALLPTFHWQTRRRRLKAKC